jgi:hypothetical protein
MSIPIAENHKDLAAFFHFSQFTLQPMLVATVSDGILAGRIPVIPGHF